VTASFIRFTLCVRSPLPQCKTFGGASQWIRILSARCGVARHLIESSSQPRSKENRYPPTQIGPAPGFWLKEFFGRSLGVRWVRSRADVPNSQTVARYWSAPSRLLRVQHVHRWRPHQLSSAFSHHRNIRSIRGYAWFSRLPVISVLGVRKTTNSLPLSPDQWDSPPEESYDWPLINPHLTSELHYIHIQLLVKRCWSFLGEFTHTCEMWKNGPVTRQLRHSSSLVAM